MQDNVNTFKLWFWNISGYDIWRRWQVALRSLTAVTNYRLHWQLLQTADNFDSFYKMSAASKAVTMWWMLWQLLQTVDSFDSCHKLSTALAYVTNCWQLWQLFHDVDSFDTPHLIAATSCPELSGVTNYQQFWLLLHFGQLLQALDCFDSWTTSTSTYLQSKSGRVASFKVLTRFWVSQLVADMGVTMIGPGSDKKMMMMITRRRQEFFGSEQSGASRERKSQNT